MQKPSNLLNCNKLWQPCLMAGLLLLLFGGVSVHAAEPPPPPFIQFSIQDASGNFFPQGEVEFCTSSGRCVYADIQQGFPGNFYLPSAELQADTLYTVMIYDRQVKVLWEMRDWKFEPRKYEARFNRWLNVNKFLIFPRFFVHDDRSMTFEIETTLNPEWERLMGQMNAYTGPDSLPDFPDFALAATTSMPIGGRFRSDENAAAGVNRVKPGFELIGIRRWGYPQRRLKRDFWASFREVSVGYNQNRYDLDSVMTPGRTSDVIFHRMWVALGYGRINQEMTTQWSVSASLAHGRIYDGSDLLVYLDRTYKMFGTGLQLRWMSSLYSTDRADFGWFGQVEARQWFVDAEDDDFWVGWEPSLSIGLVVY